MDIVCSRENNSHGISLAPLSFQVFSIIAM